MMPPRWALPFILLYASMVTFLLVTLTPNLSSTRHAVAGGCIGVLVTWGYLWVRSWMLGRP